MTATSGSTYLGIVIALSGIAANAGCIETAPKSIDVAKIAININAILFFRVFIKITLSKNFRTEGFKDV